MKPQRKKKKPKAKSKAKRIKDPISKELYSILACPDCKSDVKYNSAKTALVCVKCRQKYAIRNGIPIMLPAKK